MNWDQIEGKWRQIKGKVREQWGKFTDDDLDFIAGTLPHLRVGRRLFFRPSAIARFLSEREIGS